MGHECIVVLVLQYTGTLIESNIHSTHSLQLGFEWHGCKVEYILGYQARSFKLHIKIRIRSIKYKVIQMQNPSLVWPG